MDDPQLNLNDLWQKSNQLFQHDQMGFGPGRVAPPLPVASGLRVPSSSPAPRITTTQVPQRSYRRVQMPVSYMPSTMGASYGGSFGSYPYGRSLMNMGGYSPYSSYGQSMTNQYQNPVVIAAAENSRPAFESIQSVVQSFNAVSMMLESTFTAMHMSFEAMLGVAENFTRLKSFMTKLYSTVVTFKLARWFLAKLVYLIRLIKGNASGLSVEEELWSNITSSEAAISQTDGGRSWPLVVFTGLLVATPYFIYKLLNSVTPTNLSPPNSPSNRPNEKIILKAPCDWNNPDPNTIPLVKGQSVLTTPQRIKNTAGNGGWLLIDTADGQRGYVPLDILRRIKTSQPTQPILPTAQSLPTDIESSIMTEQILPEVIPTPLTEIQGDPIELPDEL
ncbi:peroxisomal membrane protein PEX13 isoform X2 [Adelges cooleyi]|uniref:peroxisomal membrane protein PEX13 isoform X2 n=1 Tax=Adelges cooleyi TaxID=133065 RepID=UPI00217F64F1|nr:peroxisomal membrane protein PEX13 isoform X2 [Adelges cooleyi]